ncbi:MAG: hypothetical protein CL483_04765 [Acidobacteria bacterium]|nr:hypothetical protein [Acidobacteriota bacterium]
MRPRTAVWLSSLLVLAPLGGAACAPAETAGVPQVEIVSSRPDMVTGGDALVRVAPPPGVEPAAVRVSIDGRDVSSGFRQNRDGILLGLVADLQPGANMVSVSAGRGASVDIEVTNHPAMGPVFSGPHQSPFHCETESFRLFGEESEETLGAPLDEHCLVARRVDYGYRSVEGGALRFLADPAARPEDLAYTTTLAGDEVPYVVRIETGSVNRAIYQIAMLHDPATAVEPDAWQPSSGWNQRLIFTFGGGCVGGWYRQGARTGGGTDDVMLRQGYAVASSSLNVFGNNCNDLLAAETMMMVKERFIEGYGAPVFTIGWGCSGGSYQNHQIADNYPGLLDGIIPGCSFPDVTSGTIPFITDARLLNHYFNVTAPGEFTAEEQRAVAGFLVLNTMPNVATNAGRIAPDEFCPDVIPKKDRYHAQTNPGGARCDVFDATVNIYGRDAATGFARRPLDNVGVQYGLGALNGSVITVEQFLALNEGIGGYDHDGQFRAARTTADYGAMRAAYQTGRVTNGGGGLATTPIIDYRGYSDDVERGDVHVRYHSFAVRERLHRANGRADNHVMLVEDNRHGLYSSQSPVLQQALAQMDEWLTTLAADTSLDPRIGKVVRAKPAELVDACWTRDESPSKIAETQQRDAGRCAELYPAPPSPREVAGAAVTTDVLKCQLKPIDAADYSVRFSRDERVRLGELFPDGVCDWTQPGVEQVPLLGTWLRVETT